MADGREHLTGVDIVVNIVPQRITGGEARA
jgi:hypothetical protein